MVRVDYFPSFAGPCQLHYSLIEVKTSQEQGQIQIVLQHESFLLLAHFPQINKSSCTSRNWIPDFLVNEPLLSRKLIIEGQHPHFDIDFRLSLRFLPGIYFDDPNWHIFDVGRHKSTETLQFLKYHSLTRRFQVYFIN